MMYLLTRAELVIQAAYDWITEEWTAPLTAVYAKIIKVGDQTLQLRRGDQYYLAAPPGGPDWGIRSTLAFLFPRAQ